MKPVRAACQLHSNEWRLTWEQLGQLFEVSRRSAQFWASGKPLNSPNEARSMWVLDAVRDAYRGSARSTRAALLDVNEVTTAFQLLVGRRFDEARAVLGSGVGVVQTLDDLTAREYVESDLLDLDHLSTREG